MTTKAYPIQRNRVDNSGTNLTSACSKNYYILNKAY